MHLACRLCGVLHYTTRSMSRYKVKLLTMTKYIGDRQISSSSFKLSGVEGLGTGKSARLSVDLDSNAEKYLMENNLKPKDHPGVFHLKRRSLPPKFTAAVQKIMSHENVKSLYALTEYMRSYLRSRQLPVEEMEYREQVEDIERKITMKDDILRPFLSQEQLEKLEMVKDNKIRARLKRSVYHWEAMNYTKPKTLQYLLCRTAGEYAALLQIFSEIQKRDEAFKPTTLFDFGSGVGTNVWAARTIWPSTMKEVMCVDVSGDMNDLAEILLRGGNMNNDHGIPALYFRQFLPQSSKVHYNMVVSAYSLMELPSLKARLKTIDILWKKTENYLVIVEQGTLAGFKAVIEARDYILELDKKERNDQAHVFSPCPNDSLCPRFTQDDTPCNFYVKFKTLYPFHGENTETEVFSYVVLKKGPREPNDEQWPRLIRDPLIKRRHCICRVCTKDGKLAEVLLTKHRHSQTLYRVGRKSNCGDRLPIKEIDDVNISSNYQEPEKSADSEIDNDTNDRR